MRAGKLRVLRGGLRQGGFALPTVLVASVVLLVILTTSVSTVATIRTTLNTQHYEQLAKTAGEAGVAYAKACLSKNANVPQWDDAKPLKPDTNCQGDAIADGPSRYLVETDDLRSSFTVGSPTLNSEGQAVKIAQNGFVELLRKSDALVWRIYTQTATQSASVPELCSGATTSALGWRNAHKLPVQDLSLAGPGSSAQSISSGSTGVHSGYSYFRKDFYVRSAGSYKVTAMANSGQTGDHVASVYLNGQVRLGTVQGSQLTSAGVALSEGCHTVTIRTHNRTLGSADSKVVAAVYKDGSSAPVVATDSTWRVNTGELRHFSEEGYNADLNKYWPAALNSTTPAAWTSAAATIGNSTARQIRPPTGYTGGTNPGQSYYYFRSPQFTITGSRSANVNLAALCSDTDVCDIYIDGSLVDSASSFTNVSLSTITLPPGSHRVGVVLYNTGSARSTATVTLALVRGTTTLLETGIIASGDDAWRSADVNDSSEKSYMSYDVFHMPSPGDGFPN